MPKPENILKLCKYFDDPGERIKKWKEKKGLTYREVSKLLGITHSGFGRLLSGKIHLSYQMYLKLKKLEAL